MWSNGQKCSTLRAALWQRFFEYWISLSLSSCPRFALRRLLIYDWPLVTAYDAVLKWEACGLLQPMALFDQTHSCFGAWRWILSTKSPELVCRVILAFGHVGSVVVSQSFWTHATSSSGGRWFLERGHRSLISPSGAQLREKFLLWLNQLPSTTEHSCFALISD